MEKLTFKLITEHGFKQFKNGVGKDELRPTMTGLIVDFNTEKAYVTDAHILVRYPISVSEKTDVRISIPLSAFDKTKYMFGDYSKVEMNEFDFEYDIQSCMITVFYNEKEVYKVQIIEGVPPKCEAVIHIDQKGQIDDICLDMLLIERLRKCIFLNTKNNAITFQFNEKNRAVILIDSKADLYDRVYGLIMPTLHND